ncbi:triosephosphate isomerase, partial [Coelomomyces lativittatus]
MASRKFFVGGNWKMNGSKALASDLVSKLNAFTHVSSNVDIVVAPPALYLSQVRQELNPSIGVAAQNCYFQAQGAFTGELSPVMLKDVGVDYVILGHSERRTLFNETSELVAQKASFALQHHLGVIACIGETAIERSQNQTWEVLRTQLTSLLVIQDWSKVVIAYEP